MSDRRRGTPESLETMLGSLDRPETPPQPFAEALRARLLASLEAIQPQPGDSDPMNVITALPMHPARGLALPKRRFRWVNLIEIAAMLALLLGGLRFAADVGGDHPALTPAFAPPAGGTAAAMGGGDVARSGGQPGPAPAGAVKELWHTTGVANTALVADQPVARGDTLYRIIARPGATGTDPWSTTVEAVSIQNGSTRWSVALEAFGTPAVDDERVYVETSSADGAGSVVALAAATGAEVWRAPIGPQTGAKGNGTPAVLDGVVYAVDPDGTAYAFEAATGAVRWTSTAARAQDAGGTSTAAGQFAIGDGMLYLVNGDGALAALKLADGSNAWSIAVADRFQLQALLIRPFALPGAVLIQAIGPDARPEQDVITDQITLMAAISSTDGKDLWAKRYASAGAPVAIAGDLILMPLGPEGPNSIHALDTQSGDERWQRMPAGDSVSSMIGTPAIASGRAFAVHAGGLIVEIDLTDGHFIDGWTIPTQLPLMGSPVIANGVLVAQGTDGSLVALVGSDTTRLEAATPAA